MIVWLTGLSSCGKSSIADGLVKCFDNGIVVDGGEVRGLAFPNLGFSMYERSLSMLMIRNYAKFLEFKGFVPIVTTVTSPYGFFSEPDCFVVCVCCSVDVCKDRDVRGVYGSGDVVGVDIEYRGFLGADLFVSSEVLSVSDCVGVIFDFVNSKLKEEGK